MAISNLTAQQWCPGVAGVETVCPSPRSTLEPILVLAYSACLGRPTSTRCWTKQKHHQPRQAHTQLGLEGATAVFWTTWSKQYTTVPRGGASASLYEDTPIRDVAVHVKRKCKTDRQLSVTYGATTYCSVKALIFQCWQLWCSQCICFSGFRWIRLGIRNIGREGREAGMLMRKPHLVASFLGYFQGHKSSET